MIRGTALSRLDRDEAVRGEKKRVTPARRPEPPSLTEIAKTAAEDLLDLLASQIRLARFELASDVRGALMQAARIAVYIPILLIGYAFAMAAGASFISRYWGWTVGLASVASLQLLVGIVGVLLASRRLRLARLLKRTETDALENVRQTIAAVSNPARSGDV